MPGTHIDIQSRTDLQYWCGKLQCTAYQLRDAVSQVGPLPSNVEAYLRQRSDGLHNIELPRGRRPS